MTAAHLILGLFRIGKAGEDLAAGSDPIHLDSQAGLVERGRIIAHPDALDGDPPIDIAGVRLLVELELHGNFELLAVEDAGAVDADTGEDGVAVLDPAFDLGVVAAFVVTIVLVAVGGVVGEDMGLVVAVKALVDVPAAFERLGHACAVVLQPGLKDGVVGAIAAGRDVDGRIPHVQVAVPAVELAVLVVGAVEVSGWVRVCRLGANFVHLQTAAFDVEIFDPGELRQPGDIRAEDGDGASGAGLDPGIIQFKG